MKTLDDFYEKYTPLLNPFYEDEDACSWNGCMLETYGQEIDYVLKFANNPALKNNLWTIVEGDNGEMIISADCHLVNRVGYLITNEPWDNADECYVDDDYPRGVLIVSDVGVDDETKEPLYWNNTDGWVLKEDADVFNSSELLILPIDSHTEEL